MDEQMLAGLEERLGYRFKDRSLLQIALTHASIADRRVVSNERLEFLGDAVLGLITCEHLFRWLPERLEGELTKIKSHVVSRQTCAEIALELGLDACILLGKGMGPRNTLPSSVVAAVLEAVIGAVYLDGGLEPARALVLRSMEARVERASRTGHQYNYKSVVQQSLLSLGLAPPTYLVLDEKGPDHAKCFEVAVVSGERRFPACWGPSKKAAEQLAALEALRELGVMKPDESGLEVIRWPASPGIASDHS
ncbi:MAG: ribonuclease III [Planctomycetaceae bacterium]|nr:ribonuclease III [Planctomycetaceae bacterium]